MFTGFRSETHDGAVVKALVARPEDFNLALHDILTERFSDLFENLAHRLAEAVIGIDHAHGLTPFLRRALAAQALEFRCRNGELVDDASLSLASHETVTHHLFTAFASRKQHAAHAAAPDRDRLEGEDESAVGVGLLDALRSRVRLPHLRQPSNGGQRKMDLLQLVFALSKVSNLVRTRDVVEADDFRGEELHAAVETRRQDVDIVTNDAASNLESARGEVVDDGFTLHLARTVVLDLLLPVALALGELHERVEVHLRRRLLRRLGVEYGEVPSIQDGFKPTALDRNGETAHDALRLKLELELGRGHGGHLLFGVLGATRLAHLVLFVVVFVFKVGRIVLFRFGLGLLRIVIIVVGVVTLVVGVLFRLLRRGALRWLTLGRVLALLRLRLCLCLCLCL